jgi:ABC-type phosphate transport system substrate-binding protein
MSAFKQSMRKFGVRAGLLAGTSLAVVAIAGVGASSASAACSGTIKGQGSSLQRIAQQEIWTPSYTAASCTTGTNATPAYTSSSSGTGMASWGSTGGAINREWTFIGTDDGPTAATQIANMRTAAGAGSELVVVPVAQTAIAIMVHPPAECSITNITNANLEDAFSGKAETWTAIGATGAGCGGSLTRVVRKDASGTTYQFKNYLSLVNALRHSGTEEGACSGQPKWSSLEEISGSGGPNLEWPACGTISQITPAGTGGGEVAAKVVATAGTIGYAALPDAKSKGATSAKVQNNGISGSPIFASPEKTTEEANCAKAEYNVPEGAFTSKSGLNVDWSKVFGGTPSIGSTTYPICTLTYDLAWHNYVTAGFAAGIGSSVKSYLNHIITSGTGTGTVKKWYSDLPVKTEELHNVKMAAEFAVSLIG